MDFLFWDGTSSFFIGRFWACFDILRMLSGIDVIPWKKSLDGLQMFQPVDDNCVVLKFSGDLVKVDQ